MTEDRPAIRCLRVHGADTDTAPAVRKGRRLPRSLVIEPGDYAFSGRSFTLREPGVYRFEGERGLAAQRLIPGGSVAELLADLSWIFGYGTTEDGVPTRRRLRLARSRRVSLTCTPLSSEVVRILSACGFTARLVLAFTRDELNDDDNGHTMTEIRDRDGWVLYDPSFKTFFRRDGRRLSFLAWCEAVARAGYEVESSEGGLPPLGSFAPSSAALERRMQLLAASEEERRRWYERMAGVPLVREGSVFVFAADDPLAHRLTAYSRSYRPIEPARFRSLWDADSVHV